jgi:hypothetical protein
MILGAVDEQLRLFTPARPPKFGWGIQRIGGP